MEKDKGKKIGGVHADVFDRNGDMGVSVSFNGRMSFMCLALGHLLHDVYEQYKGTKKEFLADVMAGWHICEECSHLTERRHETTAIDKQLLEYLRKAREDSEK